MLAGTATGTVPVAVLSAELSQAVGSSTLHAARPA